MVNESSYEELIKEDINEYDLYIANNVFEDDELYFFGTTSYQSFDDRVWKSYIEDIDGGDNFVDYCEYFFSLCEEEEYFE